MSVLSIYITYVLIHTCQARAKGVGLCYLVGWGRHHIMACPSAPPPPRRAPESCCICWMSVPVRVQPNQPGCVRSRVDSPCSENKSGPVSKDFWSRTSGFWFGTKTWNKLTNFSFCFAVYLYIYDCPVQSNARLNIKLFGAATYFVSKTNIFC